MESIKVEAVVDNLASVTEFIDSRLEAAECPVKAQMQIDISIEEIFVNIANYAYTPGTGDAEVGLELLSDPRAVRIVFIDSGVPYDPLAKPDPDVTLSAQERAIGGLGIFMVKKYMDSMAYEYTDGKNILTLEKHF
ncbi:MAG: ATP-binding protein [Ruminococcus sp.]|nr:ATP-binding protein [Ruminococcus sp.]